MEKGSRSNELITTVVELAGNYLSKNPNVLSGLPIIGKLFNGSDHKKEETKQEFEASFKAKGSSTDGAAANKEEKSDASEDVLGTELLRYFNEEETRIVMNIIYQLTLGKSVLPSILDALTRDIGELNALEAAAAKATA